MHTVVLILVGLVYASGVGERVCGEEDQPTTRPATCAGKWYPAAADELSKTVGDLLAKAPACSLLGKPSGLIAPHAAYKLSGAVTAAAYHCLEGQTYKRVFVLAFSHSHSGMYQGIDVPKDLTAYATPLGVVPIDRAVCDDLLAKESFTSVPDMGRTEHSLELQLPFLQEVCKVGQERCPPYRLVPLLIGRMTDADYVRAAQAILPWVDDQTLIVASSDFTHFGPEYSFEPFKKDVAAKLRELAEKAAAPILKCDVDGFTNHLDDTKDNICGRGPITLLMRILSMRGGAAVVRTGMDLSGRISNEWTNSVMYQSFVFTKPIPKLDVRERAELLRLARESASAFLNGREAPKPDVRKLPPALRRKGACFVTLLNGLRMRGCIGNVNAEGPLYEAAIQNASLACQDSRLTDKPVTAEELGEMTIEISYVTPMNRVKNVEEIVVGRHGLMLELEGHRGVLLPQMAYELGWSRAEFLEAISRKACQAPDAWKSDKAQISTFEAEIFAEAGPPKGATTRAK